MAERPEWLEGPTARDADRTRVGVAICVTDAEIPLVHAGVLHWEPNEAPYVLHLAFHARVANSQLPDGELKFFWSELPLGDEAAAAVAGFCRRVAKRRPPIKYGIVYEGGKLADDGRALLGGQAVGLTCATFVLALLSTFNHELLALGSWPARPDDDDAWHGHIVSMLTQLRQRHPDDITEEHIAAVRKERGCCRYRPEEVAAAAKASWPAAFATIDPLGQQARAFLLADAKADVPPA